MMKFPTALQIAFAFVGFVMVSRVHCYEEIEILDMRDWELASEQCQAIPRRIRRTEYLSTDENFECPEKDTDYYNTLEYRFKAKTSMQKIVAGERQPFYKFLCCHATAPKEKRRLFNGF